MCPVGAVSITTTSFSAFSTIFAKALKTAIEELGKKKPEFKPDNFAEKLEALVKANKKGAENITTDMLGKCKAPKVGLTIAAGAAILGLLTPLLFRPKAKENA